MCGSGAHTHPESGLYGPAELACSSREYSLSGFDRQPNPTDAGATDAGGCSYNCAARGTHAHKRAVVPPATSIQHHSHAATLTPFGKGARGYTAKALALAPLDCRARSLTHGLLRMNSSWHTAMHAHVRTWIAAFGVSSPSAAPSLAIFAARRAYAAYHTAAAAIPRTTQRQQQYRVLETAIASSHNTLV